MRPIYETEENIAVEKSMAAWIEPIWKCKVRKLPRAYNLDYAVTRDNKITAWLELKRRYRTLSEHPTVFLSLQKVMAAERLYGVTRLPCLFVVQFNDGYAYTSMLRERSVEFRGRVDRGDIEDQEPVVVIPVEQFKRMSPCTTSV
jgi:RecB family exonuclease